MGIGGIRKRIFASATAGSLALTMLLPGSASGIAPRDDASFNWSAAGAVGWSEEIGRPENWKDMQAKRLAAAIVAVQPHRPGVVDSYVLSVGFNSDPVFQREAAEAAKVLSRRYKAVGRTISMAAGSDLLPQGSPDNLAAALDAISKKMNPAEDVLILFVTTHGSPDGGLIYQDGETGVGAVGPQRLSSLLEQYGFKRQMVILSACFAGIFVPALYGEEHVTVTAASAEKTSFGCVPSNDWTFFGDAFINNAMRKPQPLIKAVDEAMVMIKGWETQYKLDPSQPQIYLGSKADSWLTLLDSRAPKTASPKVGKPAISSIGLLGQ